MAHVWGVMSTLGGGGVCRLEGYHDLCGWKS